MMIFGVYCWDDDRYSGDILEYFADESKARDYMGKLEQDYATLEYVDDDKYDEVMDALEETYGCCIGDLDISTLRIIPIQVRV